ncbi:hypothetical protein P4E94_15255 [Pontiellaceae bacterium B12219]|nr:hypothetical protein [Pontiellaceae bacterium B12219]
MRAMIKNIGSAAVLIAMFGSITAYADELDWENTQLDNNFSNTNNWSVRGVSGYDFRNISLTNANRAIIGAGETNVVSDIRVGIHGDGELEITGGYTQCNRGSGDTRIGLNGYDGLVNMSGGFWKIGQDLALGISAASKATFNLSGGEVRNDAGKFTIGEANNVGRMEISGGSFGTRGYADIFGSGTFAVHGSNATAITIGTYASNDSYWNQRTGGTLEIRIDDNGVTPIHVLDYDNDGSGGDVTFAFGALLDVDFASGVTPVSNTWTVMTWEGDTMDNGLQFSTNVDFNIWSFAVTNNSLALTYGVGSTPPETNLPPTEARDLYWTGLGGTTDPTEADNWAVDVSGTPASWGVYSDDTWRIGHYLLVPDAAVTSIVDYVGGTVANQNSLLIGDRRSGVFNMNSGDLNFSGGATIGFGAYSGSGILNLNSGSLNLKYFRSGMNSASAAFNINGGTYTSTSAYRYNGVDTGAILGWGTGGYAELNVTAGSFDSRFGAYVGVEGGIGRVHVEGSAATSFGFGTITSAHGYWYQGAESTLSLAVDGGGITPIVINGDRGVSFASNSIIDVAWSAGVTNYGVFDVMTWNGEFVDEGLTLGTNVNTDIWSFAFADSDNDGTNDTLQVIADPGTTANGTPILWLYEYGLDAADDIIDNDGDGMLTWEEYIAGTDPMNENSVLKVTSMGSIGTDYVLTWQSVAGKSYSIITNTGLVYPSPGVAAAGIIGEDGETSVTSSIPSASTVFFEVGVE